MEGLPEHFPAVGGLTPKGQKTPPVEQPMPVAITFPETLFRYEIHPVPKDFSGDQPPISQATLEGRLEQLEWRVGAAKRRALGGHDPAIPGVQVDQQGRVPVGKGLEIQLVAGRNGFPGFVERTSGFVGRFRGMIQRGANTRFLLRRTDQANA